VQFVILSARGGCTLLFSTSSARGKVAVMEAAALRRRSDGRTRLAGGYRI
jgi:hypothetical protein